MTRPVEKAKSELVSDFHRQYMKSKGLTVITVEVLHSPEYIKALQAFWKIFTPIVLERLNAERNTK